MGSGTRCGALLSALPQNVLEEKSARQAQKLQGHQAMQSKQIQTRGRCATGCVGMRKARTAYRTRLVGQRRGELCDWLEGAAAHHNRQRRGRVVEKAAAEVPSDNSS